MDPKELVRRRPGAKQALRIRHDGRIETATADATIPAEEILRLRRAFAAIGARLGLGSEHALACSDGKEASLVVFETAEGTFALVEPGNGDIDKRATEARHLVEPEETGAVVRRHGILEVRR